MLKIKIEIEEEVPTIENTLNNIHKFKTKFEITSSFHPGYDI
jgi:hypothetical protein